MKAISFHSVALGALVVVLSVFSGQARADQKVDHPLNCVPLSPQTNHSDLYYRPVGVKNIRATTEYVVCGLTVDLDQTAYWSTLGLTPASLSVTFHAPTAGTADCEVSLGSNLDGTKATFTGSVTLDPGEVGNANISGISGDTVTQNFMANYPASLYCTIPPEWSVLRVRVNESGTTD